MAEHGFGLVGCGMIADFHARAIGDIPGARLVACFDTVQASVERFAAAKGCRGYQRLDEMLADRDVTIVTVCTPSGAHMDPAVAAARAGKHVVVEKPLEITLERCDQIIGACDQAGVKLCTIFPSRFSAANRLVKDAIDAGRFGRLTLGDAYVKWWRTQQYYDSGGWRGTWALDGGGALMNQAIHNVDLLYWLMGDVAEIRGYTATLAHERIEVEDVAVASLRFRNGALGVIEASTAAYPGFAKRIEIHGDHGSVTVDQDDITVWQFDPETDADRAIREQFAGKSQGKAGASDPKAISHAGHAVQLTDFVQAIGRGTAPLVDGREGRKSVEIILAIYEASRSGNTVPLPLAKSPGMKP
jgi:predicted dehydrogenase